MYKLKEYVCKNNRQLDTKIATTLCVALSLLSTSPQAAAEDGTISFTGSVSSVTCIVTGGTEETVGSNNFTVPLKTVSTTALSAAGQHAQATKFHIALSGVDCTDGALANVSFERARGTIDETTGNLINTAAAGSAARNVQIRILNKDTAPLNLSLPNDRHQEQVIASNTARFDYWAEYIATGVAGAGNVESSLVYSIVYN
ncbi:MULTISPECIES: fimbrial protein [Yersinia]|uniref:Fimbrial protein n=1 Tax=Yersinia intermedia TaxID=631 RepID=A0A0H5M1L2_YERIN|nr:MULTISPECIES: fimbrial protein [Yersinia]MCB5309580.1 type 1 fimbrial protein [Yersinia massiliensis]CRY56932.1 fimbrial protein [Yersinia intermedia]